MQMRRSIFGQLRDALSQDWRSKARPEQLPPPGDWLGWLVLAGRGFGKTRTGAEWVHDIVASGSAGRIALVAPTAGDARDTMVEGVSGILRTAPSWNIPEYEPSKRRLSWRNGAIATTFSSEEADRLRGPEHDGAWCDEMAVWNDPQATWDMLQFGLRAGTRPRWLVTTTPKPLKLLKELLARDGKDVVVTRGSTFDNAANLAPSALAALKSRYGGTRLGRQELNAELLEDVQGAFWSRKMIEDARHKGDMPVMKRIVVAIDPSGTRGETDTGDSVGIVIAGLGFDNIAYVLSDRTIKASPAVWGACAVKAYRDFKADRIVAEKNFGGAMVEHVIRTVDHSVSYRDVTASRGKVARAEPVAALYEQGRVRHRGDLTELEDQLTAMTSDGFAGEGSPDRADALVWAITELMLQQQMPTARTGRFIWG